MSEPRIATLFETEAQQAVCLPAEFRFDSDEVYISRDDATGDVVLSSRPGGDPWDAFFDLLRAIDVPEEFMADRPLNRPPREHGVFDDEAAGRRPTDS